MDFQAIFDAGSKSIVSIAGTITAIYVIWEKLIRPALKTTKKKVEEAEIKRKTEIKEIADAVASEQGKKIDVKMAEINTSISEIAKMNGEQNTALAALETRLNDGETDRLRWEILNFAAGLRDKNRPDAEAFDHITDAYEQYEKILASIPRKNGKIEHAHAIIDSMFQERYPDKYADKYPESELAKKKLDDELNSIREKI